MLFIKAFKQKPLNPVYEQPRFVHDFFFEYRTQHQLQAKCTLQLQYFGRFRSVNVSVKRGNAKRSSQTRVSCGMQLCCVARILYHHVQRESVVLLALLPIHTFNKIANFWDGSLQSMDHFTSANGLGVFPLLDRQMNPSNCPSLFQPHPFQLSLCYHRNHHHGQT